MAGRTQFANDLLATELAARLHGTPVGGDVRVSGRHGHGRLRNARGLPWIGASGAMLQRLIALSPEWRPDTGLPGAGCPGHRHRSHFYGPRLKERPVPARAQRPERRSGLWAASEDLVRPYLQ